jgi:hypothetical protein
MRIWKSAKSFRHVCKARQDLRKMLYLTGFHNWDSDQAEGECGGLAVYYLTDSKTQDDDTDSILCKSGSKFLKKFMFNHQTAMNLKVEKDVGAATCGSGFINSLKCCHSASLYAMNCHRLSGHFQHWYFHLDLSIWQEDMQIEPPVIKKNQVIPCPAALDRNPALDFPFSNQHWTQNTGHGVGVELGFPCCYF